MVRAQWPALLYWPRAEFMYLVLTTSTGEAMMVVQKPAPKAEVKWQGRSSAEEEQVRVRTPYPIIPEGKRLFKLLERLQLGPLLRT